MTQGDLTVDVVRNPDLDGDAKWIAGARWDRYNVTDPMPTLADATEAAEHMIATEESQ